MSSAGGGPRPRGHDQHPEQRYVVLRAARLVAGG
jgi:hypothetical protein